MIVTIGGQKGGTGKTTLATNLAVMRAAAGKDVCIVDTDPQGSASLWASSRSEEGHNPRVQLVQKTGKSIIQDLLDLGGRFDDLIIDAGGRDNPELRQAIVVADVLYTPIQASQYDVDTLDGMTELVEGARAMGAEFEARILLTRVPTHPTMRERQEAEEAVADYPAFTLSRAYIRERVCWRKTTGDGLGITEYRPVDDKAVDELGRLYREIF